MSEYIDIVATAVGAAGAGTAWSGAASLVVAPEPWTKDARCVQTDPDLFFPETMQTTADAKKVCGRCTVAEDCLTYALENNEREGIWGGLTPRERARLVRGGAA